MNTQPVASLDLSDIAPFRRFCRDPNTLKLASEAQLQWWIRHRHENGLSDCGAVVERFVNPASKRPVLFVVRPRFVEWLAGVNARAV